METEIFKNLEGTWSFERHISGEGTSIGKAAFRRKSPDTLFYREDALFTDLKGASFQNFREYLYQLVNSAIRVSFVDGRLLHTLVFEGVIARGNHLCNCDMYDAEYFFEKPSLFTLTYNVKGPKKDFQIRTAFTKLSS